MQKPVRLLCVFLAVSSACTALGSGQLDPLTLVSAPHGTFNGVAYTRFEAMFDGFTSNGRHYRVPCQIITPQNPLQGRRLLLFDWLVPSTIPTAVGQEQADARYTMTDAFLFGYGVSYATVRCQADAIGKTSPISDPSRPWSDNLLNTSSEFIQSAGDEFDIVTDYLAALRSDPTALSALGQIQRRAAFGYSASGFRLRGFLRLQMGRQQFDFSLVGGTGSGYTHPIGNGVGSSSNERPPLKDAGLEIDFQSEADVVALDAHKARHEESNYRVYQFAGATHLRNIDAAEFGLASPETANPADWVPFFRALFVAADQWCDGIAPPPSIWLGAPNDASIARDANGNALVRYVGGVPISTHGYRLPEVAVGLNQYIPFDPAFNTGPFLGLLRALAGGFVDLSANFTDHDTYVAAITAHARALQANRYLLPADADAIIQRAIASDVGN